jgi:hypothetical protein
MSKIVCVVALPLFLAGCMAPVGSKLTVPPDAADTCASQCGSIGLRMTAVAIMANNVGCVCQPAGDAAPATADQADPASSAATAGGMATIMLEQQHERQQAQQTQPSR